MSALAIDSDNWHGAADLSASPFDNIEASTTNSGHVSLTQSMADFAITEIVGTLGISDLFNDQSVRVLNPAHGVIEVLLAEALRGQSIQGELYQLDGRLVAHKTWENAGGVLSWAQTGRSGLYILRLYQGRETIHLRVVIQ